jgi:hypothetical protein
MTNQNKDQVETSEYLEINLKIEEFCNLLKDCST